jgi:hypothetical protein
MPGMVPERGAGINPENTRLNTYLQRYMLKHMKRTTLLIDNGLHTELKKRAADEGRTLTEVVEQTLRRGLLTPPTRRARRSLPSYDLGPWLVDPAAVRTRGLGGRGGTP